MLCKEIIAVYYEDHTRHSKENLLAKCGSNVNEVLHTVAVLLQTFDNVLSLVQEF
jgi:hypothetical protein